MTCVPGSGERTSSLLLVQPPDQTSEAAAGLRLTVWQQQVSRQGLHWWLHLIHAHTGVLYWLALALVPWWQ